MRRGGVRIMIAGNPYPFGDAGERGEHSGGVGFEPGRPGGIVEAVAQAIDPPGPGLAQRQRQPA